MLSEAGRKEDYQKTGLGKTAVFYLRGGSGPEVGARYILEKKSAASRRLRYYGEALQVGEKGEIVLGGPCIMKGYYKNPEATQEVIKTDEKGIRWLHTGDLGHLDEDGCLYITGRKKYLIVLPGGKNVNPELVESVLSQAQFVEEVLVVPGLQKDSAERTEEAIRAIVRPAWDAIQTETNLSCPDLVTQPQVLKKLLWQNIKECQQQSRKLSSFEKVSSQHLEIRIDEFQKTSTGKIKRNLYIKIPQK